MKRNSDACRRRLAAVLVSTVALLSASGLAEAQSADEIPVPRVVIYPGDVISSSMLTEAPFVAASVPAGLYIEDMSEVVGKAAQRTLLPGQAIMKIAVTNPTTVRNGSQVTLYYRSGALEITTDGMALQDGFVGDMIRVRNDDSGVTVSGVVQNDGSVQVSGG